jgi:hypothetical protein
VRVDKINPSREFVLVMKKRMPVPVKKGSITRRRLNPTRLRLTSADGQTG